MDMTTTKSKNPRTLRRISAENYSVAKEVFKTLAALGEPTELTQRRLFIQLIPHVYVLRHRYNYTFKQISRLCNECGLKLSESTIRVYYSKFALQMKAECEAALAEMELIARKIENNTKQLTRNSLASLAEMAGGFIPHDRF